MKCDTFNEKNVRVCASGQVYCLQEGTKEEKEELEDCFDASLRCCDDKFCGRGTQAMLLPTLFQLAPCPGSRNPSSELGNHR